MNELRVITDNLPKYKFPATHRNPGSVAAYSLIQSRNKDRVWEPRWCLIDMNGTVLAILEADNFDGVTPESIAQKTAEFVMDMHDLGEDETGVAAKTEFKYGNNKESYSFEF